MIATRRLLLQSLAPALLEPASAAQANAAAKVALVVGNSQYADAPLRNPGEDALAVAKALAQLGFEVRLMRETSWIALQDAARQFADTTGHAALRLFYFAGHGVQWRGRNLLLPLDADPSKDEQLVPRSLDCRELLERMARNPKPANVMILDACRQHPSAGALVTADGRLLRARGSSTGLARMPIPAGSLVAYATAPGQVADDGPALTSTNTGSAQPSHSLYTRHLLAHLPTPGLALEGLFKRVRLAVLRDSQSRQQPWEESSLTSEVCLAGVCRN